MKKNILAILLIGLLSLGSHPFFAMDRSSDNPQVQINAQKDLDCYVSALQLHYDAEFAEIIQEIIQHLSTANTTNKALFNADLKTIKRKITKNNVNKPDVQGFTPLYKVVMGKKSDIETKKAIEYLTDLGAEANVICKDRHILHTAILQEKSADIIDTLLKRIPNIKTITFDASPYGFIYLNHIAILKNSKLSEDQKEKHYTRLNEICKVLMRHQVKILDADRSLLSRIPFYKDVINPLSTTTSASIRESEDKISSTTHPSSQSSSSTVNTHRIPTTSSVQADTHERTSQSIGFYNKEIAEIARTELNHDDFNIAFKAKNVQGILASFTKVADVSQMNRQGITPLLKIIGSDLPDNDVFTLVEYLLEVKRVNPNESSSINPLLLAIDKMNRSMPIFTLLLDHKVDAIPLLNALDIVIELKGGLAFISNILELLMMHTVEIPQSFIQKLQKKDPLLYPKLVHMRENLELTSLLLLKAVKDCNFEEVNKCLSQPGVDLFVENTLGESACSQFLHLYKDEIQAMLSDSSKGTENLTEEQCRKRKIINKFIEFSYRDTAERFSLASVHKNNGKTDQYFDPRFLKRIVNYDANESSFFLELCSKKRNPMDLTTQVNMRENKQVTLLECALEYCDASTVSKLLEYIKGVNAVNADKRTPLYQTISMYFSNRTDQQDTLSKIKSLLYFGADVYFIPANWYDNIQDAKESDYHTPVHYALECAGKHPAKGARALLDAFFQAGNVDVDIRNGQGVTPLMLAAKNGNEEIFNYLKEKGARLNAQDTMGYSVEWYAEQGKNIKIIAQLS